MVLPTLNDASVQCCVTSPPYFGLRSYGIGTENGEIGLESTPDEYVAKLVAVFREVRRVLADDGTLWLNLGDSFCAAPKGSDNGWDKSTLTKPKDGSERKIQIAQRASLRVKDVASKQATNRSSDFNGPHRARSFPGLKPKDLIGIPWMVAFALRADGWYLRSEITWCKRAPMPESVRDRPTCATEKIFLLSKSAHYYYDAESVRETSIEPNWESRLLRASGKTKPTDKVNGIRQRTDKQRGHSRRHAGFNDRWDAMGKIEQMAGGRNMRNWWLLGPEPYPEAHFAVFPTAIPERCILAGSRPGDTVLDPFGGSGTTGQVAEKLGRKWIGIELNPEYEPLVKARTQQMGMTL